MKRLLPILLSAIGCLLLISQSSGQKKAFRIAAMPQERSDKIVKAQRKYLKALATDRAQAEAAMKELQAARATVAPVSTQAAPLASATTPAPAEEVAALAQSTTALDAQAQPLAQSAARLESGLFWAALALGFASSMFSVFNWNRASAALSALVVVASGVPNVYPVHERVSYYQTLANQSHSLTTGLALSPQLTVDEYDNGVRREAALEAAIPFPGTSAGDPTAELMSALDASKISTLAAQ